MMYDLLKDLQADVPVLEGEYADKYNSPCQHKTTVQPVIYTHPNPKEYAVILLPPTFLALQVPDVFDKLHLNNGSLLSPAHSGKWTVQQAAELSVAAPTITASLDGRYLSALKVSV